MARTDRLVGGVVAGAYLAVVAGAWLWAFANEQDASLGFIVPYFVTFPLSAGLVQLLPGYMALAVAGLVQALIIYAVVARVSAAVAIKQR